jgi:hypothetical protein
MAKKKRPEKLNNVLDKVKASIACGNYRLTSHALDRQTERAINLPETLHVLKTGFEEKAKTSFDEQQNTWKYAIRGKTIRDTLDVRVIIAFDENEMLIITVMYIGQV